MDNITIIFIIGIICTVLGVLVGYIQGRKHTRTRRK